MFAAVCHAQSDQRRAPRRTHRRNAFEGACDEAPCAASSLDSTMPSLYGSYERPSRSPSNRCLQLRPDLDQILGPTRAVVLLHGLPGAGKSTIAGLLRMFGSYDEVAFDLVWLSFGWNPVTASPTQTASVYYRGIRDALDRTRTSNVIIDCTSRSAAFRSFAIRMLRANGHRVIFLTCSLPRQTARARVVARVFTAPLHPGRGARHFEAVFRTFQPLQPDEFPDVPVATVDTSAAVPRFLGLVCPTPCRHVEFEKNLAEVLLEAFAAVRRNPSLLVNTARQAVEQLQH